MGLLQMSFSGAVFIIAIVMIRAVAINKLPKKTFLVLWEIAFLRLLIPFSIPSMFSVYTLISNNISTPIFSGTETGNIIPAIAQENQFITAQRTVRFPKNTLLSASVWFTVWFIGMMLFAIFFAITYLHCLKEFRTSLPIRNEYAEQWLKKCPLKRQISIRQSDEISAPLTYGIFRPVILMPKKINWENTKQLQYILSHEYVHIYRFDTITKLIATIAFCIHWFNPMVWVMYILFNRDIELACDESVVRQFGEASKSVFARVLIDMEAKQSGLLPFCNNFSKNAIEERIRSIMKYGKLIAEINTLPSGGITCKKINGKEYAYYQWREEGKQRSRRIKDDELAVLATQIGRRKELQNQVKGMEINVDKTVESAYTFRCAVRSH